MASINIVMKNPKSICVVGGGTAGLVAALILKRTYPILQIDIVESSDIGIIGVGEGSTEHWKEFMDFLHIDPPTMLKECDATFKAGIYFENWTEKPYIQTVEGDYHVIWHDYPIVYGKLISEGRDSIVFDNVWNSEVSWDEHIQETLQDFPVAQFHFNTNKLNTFLHKTAEKYNINVYDDIITDVELDENGITTIHGSKDSYEYDFYIDCTGFKRVLMNKLDAKWKSYSEHLRMNSAIVFPTEDENEYPMWTLARAMNAGWMFRIPTYGRKGNGYIFDSNYITPEQAKEEVEAYLGRTIEVAKSFKFDPGRLEDCWIKNCAAIGLSASFVEPLEATSIGTSIQQSFLLASRIINYTDRSVEMYNHEVKEILEDIKDFVALHYVVDREDTPFWKDQKNVPLPERLAQNMEMWKHRLPIDSDFGSETSYKLFDKLNYLLVLHGIGHFNIDSIKQQYSLMAPSAREFADRVVDDLDRPRIGEKTLPHKLVIELIRRLA